MITETFVMAVDEAAESRPQWIGKVKIYEQGSSVGYDDIDPAGDGCWRLTDKFRNMSNRVASGHMVEIRPLGDGEVSIYD